MSWERTKTGIVGKRTSIREPWKGQAENEKGKGAGAVPRDTDEHKKRRKKHKAHLPSHKDKRDTTNNHRLH